MKWIPTALLITWAIFGIVTTLLIFESESQQRDIQTTYMKVIIAANEKEFGSTTTQALKRLDDTDQRVQKVKTGLFLIMVLSQFVLIVLNFFESRGSREFEEKIMERVQNIEKLNQ